MCWGPAASSNRPKVKSHQPSRLERKCAIINKMTFVAYAGSSFVAKRALSKVERALADQAPSRHIISTAVSEYEEDLSHHNTSLLIAFIDDGKVEHLTFGPDFTHHTFEDGTQLTANGSGYAALHDALDMVLKTKPKIRYPGLTNATFWQKTVACLARLRIFFSGMSTATTVASCNCPM